jgi:hypothetical protein
MVKAAEDATDVVHEMVSLDVTEYTYADSALGKLQKKWVLRNIGENIGSSCKCIKYNTGT